MFEHSSCICWSKRKIYLFHGSNDLLHVSYSGICRQRGCIFQIRSTQSAPSAIHRQIWHIKNNNHHILEPRTQTCCPTILAINGGLDFCLLSAEEISPTSSRRDVIHNYRKPSTSKNLRRVDEGSHLNSHETHKAISRKYIWPIYAGGSSAGTCERCQ